MTKNIDFYPELIVISDLSSTIFVFIDISSNSVATIFKRCDLEKAEHVDTPLLLAQCFEINKVFMNLYLLFGCLLIPVG